MSCEEARMLLDAYVDGELSAGQERTLMDHVSACDACRQEFEAAMLLKDALRDMDEEISVPLEAQAAWRNAVRREAKQRSFRRWLRWASAAAAVLVLAVGCGAMLRGGLPQDKLIGEAGEVLVAKDGAQERSVQVYALEEDYSARKKYEVEDFNAACDTIEQLVAEYSGSYAVEGEEEGAAVYRIELPKDYQQDFLAALRFIGDETDSQSMEPGGEIALIRIQINRK